MKSKKRFPNYKDTVLLKEEQTSIMDENFDWDWIFDREWLRTKK